MILKQALNTLVFFSFFNTLNLYAMDLDQAERQEVRENAIVQRSSLQAIPARNIEEPVGEGILSYCSRNAFVTAATINFGWLCERWAVDNAARIIQRTVTSSNPWLDWTVSSAIRGKSIQEALPIAQKRGRLVGMVIAGIIAPIGWDCGIAVLHSYHKIGRWIFEDGILMSQVPTKRDWLKAGTGGAIILMSCQFIYKNFGNS